MGQLKRYKEMLEAVEEAYKNGKVPSECIAEEEVEIDGETVLVRGVIFKEV